MLFRENPIWFVHGAVKAGLEGAGRGVPILGVRSPEPLSHPPFLHKGSHLHCSCPPLPSLPPWMNLSEVNGKKEGGETEMMMTDFLLLSEPGEGGCFASWTSAENSLPDNHLSAFIAF